MSIMDILLEKKDWKVLRPDDFKECMRSLPDWRYMLWLRKWAKRTLEQNRYYWNLLTVMWTDLWHEIEYLHAYFKHEFLQKVYVDEVLWEITDIVSTTKLTTKTFTEYIDKIVNWCLEHWYEIPLEPR